MCTAPGLIEQDTQALQSKIDVNETYLDHERQSKSGQE